MKIEGLFCSLWDGDNTIETPCTIDSVTGELVHIKQASTNESEGVDVLDEEYVEVGDRRFEIEQDGETNVYRIQPAQLVAFQVATNSAPKETAAPKRNAPRG